MVLKSNENFRKNKWRNTQHKDYMGPGPFTVQTGARNNFASRRHDNAYKDWRYKFYHNQHDDKFLKRITDKEPWGSTARKIFNFKKKYFPHDYNLDKDKPNYKLPFSGRKRANLGDYLELPSNKPNAPKLRKLDNDPANIHLENMSNHVSTYKVSRSRKNRFKSVQKKASKDAYRYLLSKMNPFLSMEYNGQSRLTAGLSSCGGTGSWHDLTNLYTSGYINHIANPWCWLGKQQSLASTQPGAANYNNEIGDVSYLKNRKFRWNISVQSSAKMYITIYEFTCIANSFWDPLTLINNEAGTAVDNYLEGAVPTTAITQTTGTINVKPIQTVADTGLTTSGYQVLELSSTDNFQLGNLKLFRKYFKITKTTKKVVQNDNFSYVMGDKRTVRVRYEDHVALDIANPNAGSQPVFNYIKGDKAVIMKCRGQLLPDGTVAASVAYATSKITVNWVSSSQNVMPINTSKSTKYIFNTGSVGTDPRVTIAAINDYPADFDGN